MESKALRCSSRSLAVSAGASCKDRGHFVLVFPVPKWEDSTSKSSNETFKNRLKHGEGVNTLHLRFLESIRQKNKILFVTILRGFPFGRKMRWEESLVNFSSVRRVNECGTNHRVRTTVLRLSASDSALSFMCFILILARLCSWGWVLSLYKVVWLLCSQLGWTRSPDLSLTNGRETGRLGSFFSTPVSLGGVRNVLVCL